LDSSDYMEFDMNNNKRILKDVSITVFILMICFLLCLLIQHMFKGSVHIPAIFILGSFLISVLSEGYRYGIVSALINVFAVNFAFTFPYFAIDFTIPENIISAISLLVISVITCGLTTKIKRQEQIKAESEKERMRANLLRAVSHDLRTPLTTIYGSSSVILENYDEFDDEQKKQMLKGIKEDSQWLSRMVENLLSITKLDSGNVKILKTEIVLDELLDSVLVKFAKRYPNQEVKVDIPDEFIAIPMDAILIEQVIINILENAVQHAEGMTELTLKVSMDSDKVIFEIMDNGCGIPEEKLRNIFTGDYSSVTETTPSDGKKNNAGIGLSVCASIIRAHGGNIYAKNRCLENGKGAVFGFKLDMEELKNE